MTIGDVITQLKYGELRSIAVKDDNAAIVSYINLALIALYGRFNLKTAEQVIDLSDNITEYMLASDCMTVDSVWGEDGKEIPIGVYTEPMSVFLVSYDRLQVSNPVTGLSISVIYVVNPTTLIYTDSTSLSTTVPIPTQLLEPLLHYVGYRAHGSMDGSNKGENTTHYARYEASCKRIGDMGLVTKEIPRAEVSLATIAGEIIK